MARRQRLWVRLVLIGAAVGLAALAGRLCQINTTLAADLTARAQQQQQTQREIPARRGLIFDSRGRIVAGTNLVYSAYADPLLLEQVATEKGSTVPEVARAAARLLNLDAGLIEETIRKSATPRFCWLKRQLDRVEASALRDAALPGIRLRPELKRTYPLGATMCHTVGIVGIDGNGLEGLERGYDEHLRGRPGTLSMLCDARRRVITGRPEDTQEPIDGGHIVLTIDSVIQGFTEGALARQVDEFQAEGGVAVVMNPQTGEILAMASWPTFDPNVYGSVGPEVRRNRVLTDPVEPGSTFKPIIAGGALETGRISRTERIYCHNGIYNAGGRLLKDTTPRGNLTLAEIVIHSSNIGMGIIGERLGNQALYEIIRRFGFGEPTGVGFPGEEPGVVTPLPKWSSYTKTSLPMGYEIGVTPLQLATAFCAIVNDGVLLRPRLVKALLAADGTVTEAHNEPIVVRQALPEDIAHYIAREVMVRVVTEGTGRTAALDEYQVLGKTGTTKLCRPDRRGYEPGAYLSSFVGAAPSEKPQVLVLVMIRRPNASLGYYGTRVAAPAVKSILYSTLSYLGVAGQGVMQAQL